MALRARTVLAAGTRTNSTLSAPAGLTDGDILVLIWHEEGDVTPTPPSGFAEWVSHAHSTDPTQLFIWWKRASSESGSYTITHSSSWTEAWLGALSAQYETGDPADATATENDGSSTSITIPGLTPAHDNAVIIAAYGTTGDRAKGALGGTTPTFTEDYDSETNLAVSIGTLATAGATGNKTSTISSSNPWNAAMVAIREAGGGGGGLSIPVVMNQYRQRMA